MVRGVKLIRPEPITKEVIQMISGVEFEDVVKYRIRY